MPISKENSKDIIKNFLKTKSLDQITKNLKPCFPTEKPLPKNLPCQTKLTKEAQIPRINILENHTSKFNFINGKKHIEDPSIFKGNIENFIGLAQIPIGVMNPLRINGLYANGDFYVPLATTEEALVASYNRGAKVISLSGGATVNNDLKLTHPLLFFPI